MLTTSQRAMPPPTVLLRLQSNRSIVDDDLDLELNDLSLHGDPNQPTTSRQRCFSESHNSFLNLKNRRRGRSNYGGVGCGGNARFPSAATEPISLNLSAPAATASAASSPNSQPGSASPDPARRRRNAIAPKLFSLDTSITKSTEQLGRICQELSTVNADLTHVVEVKRKLSGASPSDTSSLRVPSPNNSSSSSGCASSLNGSEDEMFITEELYELCRLAQRDLAMADLARQEVESVLNEVGMAWICEGKDMLGRAGWLRRESETFEKMTPVALKRLNSASPTCRLTSAMTSTMTSGSSEEDSEGDSGYGRPMSRQGSESTVLSMSV